MALSIFLRAAVRVTAAASKGDNSWIRRTEAGAWNPWKDVHPWQRVSNAEQPPVGRLLAWPAMERLQRRSLRGWISRYRMGVPATSMGTPSLACGSGSPRPLTPRT